MNVAYNKPFNKIIAYGSLKQFFYIFQIILIVQGLEFFVIVLLTIQSLSFFIVKFDISVSQTRSMK